MRENNVEQIRWKKIFREILSWSAGNGASVHASNSTCVCTFDDDLLHWILKWILNFTLFFEKLQFFSRLLPLDEHYMEAQNSSFNFTSDLHFKFLQMEF